MRVLNGGVLIIEQKSKERSEGGIIMPSGPEKRTFMGTVVAIGPGEKMENGERYPLDVKVGDVVAFPDRVGDPVTIDKQEMLVIKEQYLLGVLIEAEEETENGNISE